MDGRLTLRRLVLVLDAMLILVAMFFAYWAHGALREIVPMLKGTPNIAEYLALAYIVLPLWLLMVLVLQLDRVLERFTPASEILLDILKLSAAGLITLSVVLFLTQLVLNRSLVAIFLVCSSSLLFAERIALSYGLRYRHRTGQGQMRILLAGAPSPVMAGFVEDARSDPLPPHFVGVVVSREREEATELGVPMLGDVDGLDSVLHEEAVDEVLFFPPFDDPDRVRSSLQVTRTLGIPCAFAVKRADGADVPIVKTVFGHPFISYAHEAHPLAALAAKHAFDTLSAAALLLLLAPVFAVTAIAITLTMGRPIFFAQDRAGLYGRRFRMLKFRTMSVGAEAQRALLEELNELDGPVFKITDDPRVTRLGRILRKWSIDELPQLVCVLLGSMSLVGPRPLPIHEQQEIRGWHRRRLSMKPGITGLWQVSGRSEIGFEEWMKLDLRYIDEWSLRLDAWILLKTIPAVLLRRGAK